MPSYKCTWNTWGSSDEEVLSTRLGPSKAFEIASDLDLERLLIEMVMGVGEGKEHTCEEATGTVWDVYWKYWEAGGEKE